MRPPEVVLHRDLKPGNILVTVEGRVKLLDFGIAKLMEADGVAEQATLAFFTIDYAAPEQIQGAELSTTTDVYALGVLGHRATNLTERTACLAPLARRSRQHRRQGLRV